MPPGTLSSSVAVKPSSVRIRSGRMIAGQFLLEAVLPGELNDAFGFSAIEILGDERRRGSAGAAVVEVVERAIKDEEVVAELFNPLDLLARERERFGADAPSDAFVDVVDSEETGRDRFEKVVRLFLNREIRSDGRTRHDEKAISLVVYRQPSGIFELC